jgi:hypothetical protein
MAVRDVFADASRHQADAELVVLDFFRHPNAHERPSWNFMGSPSIFVKTLHENAQTFESRAFSSEKPASTFSETALADYRAP